ncbi:MAG: ABC-2 transporter permease, partial [Clostridiales bacterium]|nr:ABC-2 transporter permease [Clostridiales bacterium]
MTKLKAFVWLDFVTVKQYFTVKNLLIYAAIALYLTATSGNVSSGMGVGLMLGTMFVSHPFALGEKSNMDALYVTLSVSKKNVVAGRYLFTLALDVCAILFVFALSAIGLLAARTIRVNVNETDTLAAILALSAVFIVIQAVQLPFLFKLGYAKARFFTFVPFVA